MILRKFLAGGTLATRLVVAGTLLVIGLPVLTLLVYVWRYLSTPVPLPVVILVNGLQVLIILNALVVMTQLVTGNRIRMPWMGGRSRPMAGARETPSALRRNGPVGLRELSMSLAETIWELERNGRASLSQAILDYICDAVTTEVQLRRRKAALERRFAELEVLLTGRSGTEAPDHERR